MNLWGILYRVIVYPLELLFEVVFGMSEHWIHNPIISIVVLSLVVNLLVLPMYKQADAIQEQERDKEKSLEAWTKHIKSTFKGDERFMILQTYYRQENYKQIYVLRSSIPLLLQVPFFMAAYNFLSHLHYLDGVSMGPIKNLAEPDALITIGAVSINFLPILMTTINIIAGIIYSKGFPLKTKIQMNGIAIVFLVLLYNSPAGLVFYWTLNNVFSLVKNIIARVVSAHNNGSAAKKIRAVNPKTKNQKRVNNLIFWFSALYMAFLTGFALPTDALKGNAQEFINLANYLNPIILLEYSFCTALGVFVVWVGIFYLLAKENSKRYFASTMIGVSAISTFDVLATKYAGGISIKFAISPKPSWELGVKMTNTLIALLLVAVIYVIWNHRRDILTYVAITLFATSIIWGISNYRIIYKDVGDPYFRGDNYSVPSDIQLSTEGNNVVIIMLDRAIGMYYPYIMNNNDDVRSAYSDFTYYPNTISYGGNTIFGAPALFGGPDYSVASINMNRDLSMRTKFDQSLLVMPIIFSNNGYEVTFENPTYAGYQWIPDLSIFDGYDVNAIVTTGAFANNDASYQENSDELIAAQIRNLFCYSATKCLPAIVVENTYDNNYYALEYNSRDVKNLVGFDITYENSVSTLANMIDTTTISSDNSNHLYIMENDMTHTTLRQKDENYDNGLTDLFGNTLTMSSNLQIATYQTNEKAYELIGEWIDYLKANNVYDNTRIIIVSDHGFGLRHPEANVSESGWDLTYINPVLIMKDFDAEGFSTDESFMTNAAVPYFATRDIIDNPTNPFTGNNISLAYLNEPQVVIDSVAIMPDDNPGNTYADGQWYEVTGDAYENLALIPITAP